MKSVNKPLLYIAPVLVVVVLIGAYFYLQPKPVVVVDFTQFPAGVERKQAFVNYFQPIIEQENQKIQTLRMKITKAQAAAKHPRWLDDVLEQYRLTQFDSNKVEDWQALLARVDTIPMSLALAQAANESAWGTSRFAQKGNNFFGQWCFTQGCGLVPRSRNEGANHEVAAFDSPQQSVARYLLNLNSHPQYQKLRDVREALRANKQVVSGYAVAAGLSGYSERGEEYIKELRAMIKFNHWSKLDAEIPNKPM